MSTSNWLTALEERVEEAVEQISTLRHENQALRQRLDAAQEKAEKAATAGWEQERTEVRERVEALAERLERLLRDSTD